MHICCVHYLYCDGYNIDVRLYYVRMSEYIYYCECSVACYSVSDSFVRSRPGWWDLDALQKIQSYARYGPDTLAIRKPIYGMIWKLIPVRTVKTKGRFSSKPIHFMWVFAFVLFPPLSLLVLSICYFVLFHLTVWYIWQYDYPYHFMWH